MANAWDHLPNAKHIDRIMQSLKDDPAAWDAAWDAAGAAAGVAAWVAVWDAVGVAAMAAARDAAWAAAMAAARAAAGVAAGDAAEVAAEVAARALIAWDDCAYLLDTDPDKVRVLALLGQPAAILLLPAVIAFDQVKEMA